MSVTLNENEGNLRWDLARRLTNALKISPGKTGTVYKPRRDLIFSPNITKRNKKAKLSLELSSQ